MPDSPTPFQPGDERLSALKEYGLPDAEADFDAICRLALKMKAELDQKNRELEQFAYVISHDIKSPLSSIVLTSEMLREGFGTSLDENTGQLLDVLNRAAFKIRNLADAVLSYYRGERALTESPETFDLKPFIQSAVNLIKLKGISEIRIPEEEVLIRTNRPALEQILSNLLQNAVRYNHSEKIIIDIRFRQTDSCYYFEVKDNGSGISPADQEKIFERFVTLGEPDRNGAMGTGLGLAIVKKLVEKQGGRIRVESVPGEGSLFSFTIKKNS